MSSRSSTVALISEFFCSRGFESCLAALIARTVDTPRVPPVALYCATLWSIVRNDELESINEAVKLLLEICRRVPDVRDDRRTLKLVIDLKCKAVIASIEFNLHGKISDASLQANLNHHFPLSIDPAIEWYQREHLRMRGNLIQLITAVPRDRKRYLDTFVSDNENSVAIKTQVMEKLRTFILRVYDCLGWTTLDTAFPSLKRFDKQTSIRRPKTVEVDSEKGSQAIDCPPSPSFSESIPGVCDEVDVETVSILESPEVVHATSGNSSDESEPLMIHEWREAQLKRRKSKTDIDINKQLTHNLGTRRLIPKINKLKLQWLRKSTHKKN